MAWNPTIFSPKTMWTFRRSTKVHVDRTECYENKTVKLGQKAGLECSEVYTCIFILRVHLNVASYDPNKKTKA